MSIDRMLKLMREDETAVPPERGQAGVARPLSVTGDFSWSRDGSAFNLTDVAVHFKPNSLNVVIGPVGGGKSSLLMALLGEMYCMRGSTTRPHAAAYVAQSAWLQSDSIRGNILFGAPYDDDIYHAVIHACALERDLELFEHGDSTEIGEKGVVCSGGQRQRISAARACYFAMRNGHDVPAILDDVLSAVGADYFSLVPSGG